MHELFADSDSDKTFDPVVLEGSSGEVINVTTAKEDSKFYRVRAKGTF